MTGSIFIEQLKQSWRQILYWGFGMAFLGFFMFALNQEDTLAKQYGELLALFPDAFLTGLGLTEDIQAGLSVQGFIGFAVLTYANIIIAVFGVMAGLNIIANEEDSGSINVLLALPIPRWQVIVEKYLAYALIIIGITVMTYLGLVAGSIAVPPEIAEQVDMNSMFVGVIHMIPAGLTIMAITIFFTSIIARKAISTGLAAAFVMISYIMNVMGASVTEDSPGRILSTLSVWTYFDAGKGMREGIQAANIALLAALTLVLLVLAAYTFERRDVGT